VRPEGMAQLLFGGLFLSLFLLLDGYVLVLVSRLLGIYLLLAIVAVTGLVGLIAILGTHRARVRELRRVVADGRYPTREFRRILALLVAAVCLMVPGFATDAIGLICLIPPVNWLIGSVLERSFQRPLMELYEYMRLEE